MRQLFQFSQICCRALQPRVANVSKLAFAGGAKRISPTFSNETRIKNIFQAVGPSRAASNSSMIIKPKVLFLVSHYIHIGMSLARNSFQTFRPLLIMMMGSQVVKSATFLLAGTPWIMLPFYAFWYFEVAYTLLQCGISFVFISFFFSNLAFRPVAQRAVLGALRQASKSVKAPMKALKSN